MAEARDLDRAGRALEELARAEAVADRPGADACGVGGNLQERVERDDLVHLAAADVHVIGERVRELHRDRADLAPDAAEVVEEPCPFARKLGEQRREAQDVHAASLFRPWRPPERLRPGAATLLLEAALAGARARLRRDTAPGNGQGGTQLLDETLDRQLPVARLAPLVLRDGAKDGARPGHDAPLLGVGESRRSLDVERRLDPRRGLLRVLAARPTRARDPQRDL